MTRSISRKAMVVTALAAIAVGATAFAGGHAGNPAVKARKAHMQLYSHNLGILGAMAKGQAEYDAAAAQAAADNIMALTQLNQATYWTPGTSNAELGEETRALPAIWEAGSKAGEIGGQMREAAMALSAAAGDGKDAMAAAMGPVGGACGDCHKAYRAPNT